MPKSQWTRRQLDHGGLKQKSFVASTGTNLVWRGTHVMQSTQASKKFLLNAPAGNAIGQQVSFVLQKGTTTNTAWVVLPTGWYFQKTSNSTGATFRKAIFNAGNQSLTLVTITTARVAILANVNSVTITTS